MPAFVYLVEGTFLAEQTGGVRPAVTGVALAVEWADVTLSNGVSFRLQGDAAGVVALVGVYREVVNELGVGRVTVEINESRLWPEFVRAFPPVHKRGRAQG